MKGIKCGFLILTLLMGVHSAGAEEVTPELLQNNQPASPEFDEAAVVKDMSEVKDISVEQDLPVSFNNALTRPATTPSPVVYPSAMPSTSATLLKALGGLIVVVLTIFAASALAKRIGLTNVSLRKRIQVRENVVVGNKERLVLIDFAGQSLLLGVTTGSISLLKSVPQVHIDQTSASKENALGAKTAIDFQQKLNAFLLKGQQ